jgi:hypothetical protein
MGRPIFPLVVDYGLERWTEIGGRREFRGGASKYAFNQSNLAARSVPLRPYIAHLIALLASQSHARRPQEYRSLLRWHLELAAPEHAD